VWGAHVGGSPEKNNVGPARTHRKRRNTTHRRKKRVGHSGQGKKKKKRLQLFGSIEKEKKKGDP